MTDLLSRPILRVDRSSAEPDRSSQVVVAAAAVAAAAVGLVLCLACAVGGWFAAGAGSFPGGVRAGSLAWLLANGASLHTPTTTITVVPLGATAVLGWLLYRAGYWAGGHTTVTSLRGAARSTGVLAVAYCLSSLVVALVSRGGTVHAGATRTALATLVLGLVAGGAGILRGSGLTGRLHARTPAEGLAVVSGAAAGVATMLAAGAVLVAGSLAVHFTTAMNIAEGLHAGAVGGLLLCLMGCCLVPNAAVYAGAFAAGPGFALGTGTTVAPSGVRLGAMPAFPLLASVPQSSGGRWLQALVVVPVVAGMVAGVVVVRRRLEVGPLRAGLLGGVAGLLGGLSFAVLCELASGAVGPGRMQDVGPDVTPTLAICLVAGLIGGTVAAGGGSWLGGAARARRNRTPVEGSGTPVEGSGTPVQGSGTPVEARRSQASGSPAGA
jgi:hypothetical protein